MNDADAASKSSFAVKLTLKWSKHKFELDVARGVTSSNDFKRMVQLKTGVPLDRQKLLCRTEWKGSLPDGDGPMLMSRTASSLATTTTTKKKASAASSTDKVVVTLIGSADSLPEPPAVRTKFVEDMTPEETAAVDAATQAEALADAEGMIVALQLPPHLRDDNKTETYQYNRLVTGLPQRQIEDLLRRRRRRRRSEVGDADNEEGEAKEEEDEKESPSPLIGELAMTLGLELRRAYVNALCVLPDGTLVSGLDDGHVQLWRHGTLVRDEVHGGFDDSTGVECMTALATSSLDGGGAAAAFATGGRGCVRLWSAEGEPLMTVPSPPGTSPSSLVSMTIGGTADDGGEDSAASTTPTSHLLAASFRVTRKSDPNQFRLAPQDEEGRRRRAQAEAEEAAVQEALARASRGVVVWSHGDHGGATAAGVGFNLRSFVLEPADGTGSAPVTTLAALPSDAGKGALICGDVSGGLRVWRATRDHGRQGALVEQSALLQLRPSDSTHAASVACLQPLSDGRLLAVSTEGVPSDIVPSLLGSTCLEVPSARAVYVLDVAAPAVTVVLDAQKDAVRCMTSLPDGGLLTGGGKFDATVRVWMSSQLVGKAGVKINDRADVFAVRTEAVKLEGLGYVFSLEVLPDSKPGSRHFAIAGARYNTVKIIL